MNQDHDWSGMFPGKDAGSKEKEKEKKRPSDTPDQSEPAASASQEAHGLFGTIDSQIVPASEEGLPSSPDRTIIAPLPTQMSPARGPGETVLLGSPEIVEGFGFLVVWSGVRKGDIFRLSLPRTIVGTARDVQVFIDDPSVSRHHASIRCEPAADGSGAEFVLRDLDSSNGSLVNGREVMGPTPLKDGDTLRLGETELIFKRV